jgi:hypothetical protein
MSSPLIQNLQRIRNSQHFRSLGSKSATQGTKFNNMPTNSHIIQTRFSTTKESNGKNPELKLITQACALPHPRKAHKGGEDGKFRFK